MKKLLLFMLLYGAQASACDAFMNVGKTPESVSTESTGIAGLGCRFKHYDVTLQYVAEVRMYNKALTDPAYGMLTIARYWNFENHKLFGAHPELYWGMGFKGADRCSYNGELNCSRRQPLPYSFHFGAGLEWKALRLQFLHDSNNAMDYGPEKKNFGITWLQVVVPL